MKFGIRKPSLKKSLKARTTGKLKRSVKKALIPGYGKKGMGWIKNPKKAAYNKVYNKTSVSLFPAGTSSGKTNRKRTTNTASTKKSTLQNNQFESQAYSYIEGETEAMKVCKFCGAENQDSATVCSSCGGNEFKHKCGNCGTVFEDGNFCPKCGVKAGAKAKKCPNCGAEYFSAACPDCGYTNKAGSTTVVYTNTTAQPVKKRKTWLWVLGWIFIFPIPLTILMVRNQKLNKWVKIGIIAVAWILYLIIALAGGSGDSNNTENPGKDVSQPVVSEETVQSEKSDTTSSNTENEVAEPQNIVDDEVVNGFLSECGFDYGEIDKGNIRTKFFIHINGCRTELLNSNTNELIITINGYHIDNINEEEVLEAFKMVAQTINGNEYDTELEEIINGLLAHDTDIYEGSIGNLNYKFYPFVELSKGVSESRIEISTVKYNVE